MNVTPHEGARRLRVLADALEAWESLPQRKRGFNLTTWMSKMEDATKFSDRPECGTAVCAMGFACEVPEFQELGLRMDSAIDHSHGSPVFNEATGFGAAEEFFGLSERAALWLFHSNSYARSNAVAPVVARLRDKARDMELGVQAHVGART